MRFLVLALVCLNVAIHASEARGAIVFSDDFTGSSLDPAWSISFSNATGWNYEVPTGSGTHLRVTDILGVPLTDDSGTIDDWGSVKLSRQFQPVGDFYARFNLAWDSEGRLDPMQKVYLYLYDTNHHRVAVAGFDDSWVGYTGSRSVGIDGAGFINSDKGSTALNGTAIIEFQRIGSAFTIKWDGQTQIIGTNSTPIAEIELGFDFFNYQGFAGRSTFANESVDLITLSTPDGEVPEPASLTLWSLGALGLAAFSRLRRRQAA